MNAYSFIVPAYNEAGGIGAVLEELCAFCKGTKHEVIVIDDCSTDTTAKVVSGFPVRLLQNIQNFGYGYSLKRGIAAAQNESVIIMDADGSYPVSVFPQLIAEYEKGYDMVVGARQGGHYHGSLVKRVSRFFFRLLAEFATGRAIPDINSGCRIFKRDVAQKYFHTLSSGFSFTTTITLAFMLNALSVSYLPIPYHKRKGHSKVRYVRDTLRSGQIIIEAIVFYNPLKIFLLCALIVFLSSLVALAVSFFSVFIASVLFVGVALSVCIFSIGLLAVLVKFVGTKSSVDHV